MYCTEKGVHQLVSVIPRPSYCSVFDHIQYVEMEGRGLEAFVTLVTSRGSDWKNDFESFFFSIAPSAWVPNLREVEKLPLIVQDGEYTL